MKRKAIKEMHLESIQELIKEVEVKSIGSQKEKQKTQKIPPIDLPQGKLNFGQ